MGFLRRGEVYCLLALAAQGRRVQSFNLALYS